MAWSGKSFFAEFDPTGSRWQAFLLGGYVALVVARTLVPEDPGGKLGLGAPYNVLWIMLAIAWLLGQFRRERVQVRFSLSDILVIVLALWYAIAASVAMQTLSPRPAMNMLWDWLAMALVFLLGRQLLAGDGVRRSVIAVMIGLAVGLSAVALRQHLVTIPGDVAAYDAAKDSVEALYEATGQWLEPGSHERISFEARLASRLPTATFALSNSLAGFLVPWLVLFCGITIRLRAKFTVLASLALVGLIFYCIWLTGSRTAGVAALVGLALFVADHVRSSRLSRKLATTMIISTIVALVAAAALAVGTSFGERAASAAWRSLAFRVDYWWATLAMIRDNPIFGCGPGQFQDTYTAYKPLTSPEEIQDPHNWLFEIWSTAGTPAVILLLAIFGAILVRTWKARHTTVSEVEVGASRPAFWGGLGGTLLGCAIAWLSGYPLAWINLLLVIAAIGGAWFLLLGWTRGGSLPLVWPLLAAVALLINLLVAGGISFPAVADSLWLLLALQLNSLGATSDRAREFAPPIGVRWLIGLVFAGLLLAVIRLAYVPVLNSRLQLARSDTARAAGDAAEYRMGLDAAVAADPWSTPAATRLAAQRLADFQSLPTAAQIESLSAADSRTRVLAPRSATVWAQSAEHAAAIFRETDNVEYRRAAEGYYAQALSLYPTSSELQAAAARFWDSIGETAQARTAAQEALRIDDTLQAAGHADRVLDAVTRLEMETLSRPHESQPHE